MYNHSLFYNHLTQPIFGRNKTGHFDNRWEMLYYVVGRSFSLWAPDHVDVSLSEIGTEHTKFNVFQLTARHQIQRLSTDSPTGCQLKDVEFGVFSSCYDVAKLLLMPDSVCKSHY